MTPPASCNRTAWLKAKYAEMPAVAERVDCYLQEVTAAAYGNARLVSSGVLSRNPHCGDFFRRILFAEASADISWPTITKRLLRYVFRNAYLFAAYAANFSVCKFSLGALSRRGDHFREPLCVVEGYREEDFAGLFEALRQERRPFYFLPRFAGPAAPLDFLRIFRNIDGGGVPVLTEFQLLAFTDILRILIFIIRYPIDVMALAWRLSRRDRLGRLLAGELINALDKENFQGFIRYLVGRRLGALCRGPLELISWNENQVIDKNLYRGLKETKPEAFIWGCQTFVAYLPMLNRRIAKADKSWRMTPDCLLVNGPALIKENTAVPVRLGVSLRNGGVFSTPFIWENKSSTAIFLCHFPDLNEEILALCKQSPRLRSQPIEIKNHPAVRGRRFDLPPGWHQTDRDRFELIAQSAVLITSESSTAVEAAALGTSVIIVASQSNFTCNPMREEGRGEFWDLAFDSVELEQAYQRLLSARAARRGRIEELTRFYRKEFFVEPTKFNIMRALSRQADGSAAAPREQTA